MALNSDFNYLSLDSTEGFEDLGITNDDWIIYQKFFLPNSRIKKYFKENISSVVDYDRTTANINHAIQHVTEEVIEKLCETTKKLTGLSTLVLAGGVALNCVANGKVLR